MNVMSLKNTIDSTSCLTLEIIHYHQSGLIPHNISLALHIRNNNLFNILHHCLICRPVLRGVSHMPVTWELIMRMTPFSLALVDILDW